MATQQAQAALVSVTDKLRSWVAGTPFQMLVNGNRGSQEALDIYTRVQGLSGSSSEGEFRDLLQLVSSLHSVKRIFQSNRKFASLQLMLLCGKLCARYLAEQSVIAADQIRLMKAIGYSDTLIVNASFSHTSPNPIQNAIYIDLDRYDQSAIESFLTGCGTATAFQLASAVIEKIERPQRALVFVDAELNVSSQRIAAFVRAATVNTGTHFHTPKTYTGAGTEIVRTHFAPSPNDSLEQFSDALQVLSECFAEDDVLNRFLRLYQAIENFMVRRQVITVQNGVGQKAFSIRDFRRLYDHVDKSEHDSLKDLLQRALSIATLISGNSLANIIANRWSVEVAQSPNQSVIANDLLRTFGALPKNGGTFDTALAHQNLLNANERHKTFGILVYGFRNMIVHNKETEFHLTHSSMPQGIELFMNRFLIPSLDDIVFALLNVDKNIIWYPHPTIALYQT
jgi:hypothetical protein